MTKSVTAARAIGAAVIFLVLSSPGRTQTSAPASPSLTGEAAISALVGNTVADPGGRAALFIGQGGRYAAREAEKTVSGRWEIQFEKLCVTEQGTSRSDCWAVQVSGSDVTMTLPDFQLKGVLMPGNAMNL